jgi:hypothetical protein
VTLPLHGTHCTVRIRDGLRTLAAGRLSPLAAPQVLTGNQGYAHFVIGLAFMPLRIGYKGRKVKHGLRCPVRGAAYLIGVRNALVGA